MAVNLSKGQKISLDKGMTLALVGLGWDTNRYSGGAEFDLDASAFLLGANGKVRKDEDFIFYGNLKSADGSVTRATTAPAKVRATTKCSTLTSRKFRRMWSALPSP